MANYGRAPQPAALRLRNGAHPSKVNTREPKPRALPPNYPTKSPTAREVWDYLTEHLSAMGIAAQPDRDALLCYCDAVELYHRCREIMVTEPVIVRGQKGMVRNPAIAVMRDAANTIRQYAQEFGLTPSARARIEVRGADDDADDLFSGAA